MEKLPSASEKIFLIILAVLGWFALVGQFYISINTGVAPKMILIIRYFSYYTITTNLLAAICSTTLLLNPSSRWGTFFLKQGTRAAITVYMVIVGAVYNIILASIWDPKGFQLIIDQLLHTILPILFFLYWLIAVPKDKLKWGDVYAWLIYPFFYMIWIFIFGAITNFYPYTFINLGELGIKKGLINAALLALVFYGVSLLFVGIGKLIKR